MIQAELDKLQEFKSQSFDFENGELGRLAREYVTLLNDIKQLIFDTKSSIEDAGGDYDKFSSEYYSALYPQRTILLKNINEISPIEFTDEEDQKPFHDLLKEGELQEHIAEFLKTKFETTSDEWGNKTISAVVTNTSDVTFDYFGFDLNLVSSDGVVVQTTTASTANWTPGSVHTFETYSTKDFNKIEVANVSYNY